uniref:Uncharacterized protein n=1 Tax=Rhizophora mucronata TaxID=61149 RepID=A0A2P2NH35_RHIMU
MTRWENVFCYLSLKYTIKRLATMRTAIMTPMIHLFLFILLAMAPNTFLVSLILSTPSSCITWELPKCKSENKTVT